MFEIMKAINNYFVFESEYNTFAIVSDGITGNFTNKYIAGQYIVILDSRLNDGVYKITTVETNKLTLEATLTPEDIGEFIRIGSCRIPQDFLDLVTEITSHITNSSDGIKSKSLGDLSVNYASDSSWKSVFSSRLSTYRKMYNYFDSAPAKSYYINGRRCV